MTFPSSLPPDAVPVSQMAFIAVADVANRA